MGMEKDGERYFCKIAGVDTVTAEVSPRESVTILKNSVRIYKSLKHPNLIKLVEAYEQEELYIAVFQWAEGECLFDHWNFEAYEKDASLKSPKEKVKELPIPKKLKMVEVLFSFLQHVQDKGYVAVDFYDGSIMYDFATHKTTICDIDFFRKAPIINDVGQNWFGTKRLKAPEEYKEGAVIDEQTNLFTLGALIFEFFGTFSGEEIGQRYVLNRFMPCDFSRWQLNEESYHVVSKAVSPDRCQRYATVREFWEAWEEAQDFWEGFYMIREVEEKDLEECVELIRRSFGTVAEQFGFTEENAPRFTAFATDKQRLVWHMMGEKRPMYVYLDGEKIVGYYSLFMQENQECELSNLCVSPDYRHRGIGEALLNHAFDKGKELGCKKVNVGIVEENVVLRKWYEEQGCVHLGTKKFEHFPFTCGFMKKEL